MEEERAFYCDDINNLNCNRCPLNHIRNNSMSYNHCRYINYVLELLNIIHLNNYSYVNWGISDFQCAISKYGTRD